MIDSNDQSKGKQPGNVALASCRKLKSGIARLRVTIQAQYVSAFPERLDSIELAMTEAEASAWSTPFPSLFFPPLARIRLQQLGASAGAAATSSYLS